MSSDKIVSEIISIVEEILGLKREDISETDHFADDLGADSLDIVELIFEFEDHFDLQISEDAIDEITTIQKAANYIKAWAV